MKLFLEPLLQTSAWTGPYCGPQFGQLPCLFWQFPLPGWNYGFLPEVPWSITWSGSCCWKNLYFLKDHSHRGTCTHMQTGSLRWPLKPGDVGLFPPDPCRPDSASFCGSQTLILRITVNPGQIGHFSEIALWFWSKGHGLKFISETMQVKRGNQKPCQKR